MKNLRLPFVLLFLTAAEFVASVIYLSRFLPEKVATHFNAAGVANGWMTPGGHVQFTLTSGFGLSVLIVGLFYALRFLPPSFLNVPRKEFWMKPENYTTACAFLFRCGINSASLMLFFFSCINLQITHANLSLHLPMNAAVVVVPFLLLEIAWAGGVIHYFWKFGIPPSASVPADIR